MDEFNKIDTNGGGKVLFVEFCAYVRDRLSPESVSDMDADILSGEKAVKSIAAKHGAKATCDLVVTRKSCVKFDDLEKKVQAVLRDKSQLHRLWNVCDFNGNNICSLAEVDRMIVQEYPLLNHKPALMRAFKYTIKGSSHDDGWVHMKDFKNLLAAIFYFNKIYWFFDEVDGDDRRITLKEFKNNLGLLGVASQGRPVDAESMFNSIDTNHG